MKQRTSPAPGMGQELDNDSRKSDSSINPHNRTNSKNGRRVSITLSDVANGLDKVRWQNDYQLTACCPAHDDRNPSFSAKDDNGKILVKCFSGCTQDELINALRDLGLWHTASRYQRDRYARSEFEKAVRHHQTILALGINLSNQGQKLSELNQAQLKNSIQFLKEHSNG